MARRWVSVVGVGLAMTLAACGSSGSGSASGSGSGAASSSGGGSGKVMSSITVGINNPNVYTEIDVALAKDKGYFKDVGIDNVKTTTTDDFVAGVVSGSFDIAHGDTDQFLAAADKSPDLTLVGNYRDKEYHILGVAKGINTAQDLVGKKVSAGERGGRNEYVLKVMLKSLGVDPSQVDFVPLGGGSDARLQALVADKLQGGVILPRHLKALHAAGGKVLYNKRVPVPQESVAVNTSFLKQSPATVTAYFEAVLRARKYIANANDAQKQQIVKLMQSDGFDFPPDFVALWKTAAGQKSLDGGFDPARMDTLVKNEQNLDLLPKGLNWRQEFDFKPLWKAQKKLGLAQDPKPSAVKP